MSDTHKETKGEIARKVHKDFFDKCKIAIDEGFYLEAICMEYASMESRLKRIFELLGLKCSNDFKSAHSVGILTKIECLRKIVNNNDFFANTYLTYSKLGRIREWLIKRNTRIHALYTDTDKYEQLKSNNKKIATKGYEYANLFYKETNRLKKIAKNNPELFKKCSCLCNPKTEDCIRFLSKIKDE